MRHLLEVHANTPEEFIDALYPRASRWLPNPSAWIFRGHGDASWPLMPSAFRSTAVLVDPSSRMGSGIKSSVAAQVTAELHTLHMFLARADSIGLPFAKYDDSIFNFGTYQDKWSSFFERVKTNPEEWPQSEVLPNLALAQHYGVSTRLLDWTTAALVAGYFATRTAAEVWNTAQKNGAAAPTGAFCVWALRTELFEWARNARANVATVVRVPRHPNDNLHAQSGLFVKYWPHLTPVEGSDSFVPSTFDEVVEYIFNAVASDKPHEVDAITPALIKITAPIRFAGHVLRLMAEIGMSAAAIYPGYKGAADAVLERALWR